MSKKQKMGARSKPKDGVTYSTAPRVSAAKRRRIELQRAREEANRDLRAEGLPTPSDKWEGARERAQAARERRAFERRESPWRQLVGRVKGEGPRVQRASRTTTAPSEQETSA